MITADLQDRREPPPTSTRFGAYDVVRDLYVGALASMYLVRSAKEQRDVVVKVFRPPPSTLLSRALAIEGFLAAAEVQRSAGGRVAPILDAGATAGGAYVARPFYRCSLQWVFDTQLAPGVSRLHGVVRAILDALVEWHEATGRPHGNFKASNVFFDAESAANGRWRAVLVDPAFKPGESAEGRQARDMEQLGRSILRWVRHREAAGWPIEDSPEWKVLGRAANSWREFCNSLIDPNASAAARSLEQVRARFDRLPSEPPGRAYRRRAAGMAGLAAVGLLGYARFGDFASTPRWVRPLAEAIGNPGARVAEAPVEFGELCTEWHQWFAGLMSELNREPVRQRWLADPHLAPAVRLVHERNEELDPRLLTGDSQHLEALRANPPDAARRTVVVEQVRDARKIVAQVAGVLESWPGWKTRSDLVAAWRAQGWRAAAAAHQFSPEPALSSGHLVRAIDAALVSDAALADVRLRWNAFTAAAATLDSTSDPVLITMAAYYAAQMGDPGDPVEFAARLAEAAQQLEARASFAQEEFARRVDRVRYRDESFVRSFVPPLTSASLAQWEREVRQYFRVDEAQDPRRRDWDVLLLQIENVRDAMAGAEGDDFDSAAPVALKSSAVATAARELRERLRILRGENVLVKDLARTAGVVAALDQDANALLSRAREALEELLPSLEKVKTWLGTLRFGNPVFGAAWSERSAGLLSEAEAADRVGDVERFKHVRRTLRELATFLEAAESAVRDAGGVDLPTRDPDVAAAVARLETTRRETLSRDVLSRTVRANAAPAGGWTAAISGAEIAGLFRTYGRWKTEAAAFAGELATLGGHLRDGFDWAEGVQRDLAALLQRSQTGALEEAGGVAASWIRTARRLEVLDGTSDPIVLREAAGDPAFSVQLAAWRGLGRTSAWPSTIADLELEGRLSRGITQRVAALAQGMRQQQLQRELRDQSRLRWNGAAQRAGTSEAQLAPVLDLMSAFSISRDDLEPDVRFNYGLRQLKTLPLMRAPLAELRRKRDEFVADIKPLPALDARRDVDEFLASIADVDLSSTSRPLTAADLPPAAAGWKGAFAADGKRVTFEWTSPAPRGPRVSMDYVLVEPPDSVPFFLAAQTVSVRAFISLLEYHPAGGSVAMPEWIKMVSPLEPDERLGPRTWEVRRAEQPRPGQRRDSSLTVSREWLSERTVWPDRLYAPNAAPAPPGDRSPLQYISPTAAQLCVQHVFGARLPTPEEWRGVVHLYGKEARVWNRRDQRWELQRLHLANQGARDGFPWPDLGGYPLEPKAKQEARRAVDWDDKTLWFSPVDEGPEVGGLRHAFGNVAIYLFDEAANKFYAAGGSALSPPEIEMTKAYEVPRNLEDGFADVGVRPAFDASPEMIQRAKLQRILRQQTFISL